MMVLPTLHARPGVFACHVNEAWHAERTPCPAGGAIQTTDGSSTLQNCTFSYNNAGQLGGATAADSTDAHTQDCKFTGAPLFSWSPYLQSLSCYPKSTSAVRLCYQLLNPVVILWIGRP